MSYRNYPYNRRVPEYIEEMEIEAHPDVYGGEKCDEIILGWTADVPKEGKGPIGDVLELLARAYPPGTKVTIHVPCCPECQEPAGMLEDVLADCFSCGFSWTDWVKEEFS